MTDNKFFTDMSSIIPGFPVVNDPLYNHSVFGPEKGRGGNIGKSDEQLIQDLISIHNAENWLGLDDETPNSGPPLFGPADLSLTSKTSLPELSSSNLSSLGFIPSLPSPPGSSSILTPPPGEIRHPMQWVLLVL